MIVHRLREFDTVRADDVGRAVAADLRVIALDEWDRIEKRGKSLLRDGEIADGNGEAEDTVTPFACCVASPLGTRWPRGVTSSRRKGSWPVGDTLAIRHASCPPSGRARARQRFVGKTLAGEPRDIRRDVRASQGEINQPFAGGEIRN